MRTSLLPLRTATIVAIAPLLIFVSCKRPTATNSEAAAGGSTPVDYSPRLGVAVRTAARTCLAIQNRALPADSAVTLVVPTSPQRFVEAQISGPSPSPCPVTKEVSPGMSSYEISLPKSSDLPKLSPLIGVVGAAASEGFVLENVNVQADLDQTHAKNTFRACTSNEDIYLTVWRGIPLSGTRLWSGRYYQGENPGTLPACAAAELPPGVPARS